MKAVGSAADDMVNACRKLMPSRRELMDKREEKERQREEKVKNQEDVSDIDREIDRLEKEEKEADDFNSNECIGISTDKSLLHMFLPGGIIIFSPILFGVLFSPKCIAGYLLGLIISGIQLAISASNSGGAWDNCKKLIKTKGMLMSHKEILLMERKEINTKTGETSDADKERLNRIEEKLKRFEVYPEENITKIISNGDSEYINNPSIRKLRKSTEKASIIGDTVGDPMKDTSGPSLNILIKLSSIISVVFGTLFVKTSYLIQ